MKKNKKVLKTVSALGLAFVLLGGTVMAATTYLKWTGGATITAANDYIEKSALKLIELKKQLDDAIANGGSNETIKELETQIVLLNEEVQKANTAAASQQSKLDWAMQQLNHAGITLD